MPPFIRTTVREVFHGVKLQTPLLACISKSICDSAIFVRASQRSEFKSKKRSAVVAKVILCSAIRTMSNVVHRIIEIHALTRFETSDDGDFITLIGEDAGGEIVNLNFLTTCLSGLLITLPKLVENAEQRRRHDPSVRLVFKLSELRIELSTDRNTRILTLTTDDGFGVSFGLTEVQCREIAATSEELRSRYTN
jgi:hypothetical protein